MGWGDARRDFRKTMKRVGMSVRGDLVVRRVNAHQGIKIGGAVHGRWRGTDGRNREGKDENSVKIVGRGGVVGGRCGRLGVLGEVHDGPRDGEGKRGQVRMGKSGWTEFERGGWVTEFGIEFQRVKVSEGVSEGVRVVGGGRRKVGEGVSGGDWLGDGTGGRNRGRRMGRGSSGRRAAAAAVARGRRQLKGGGGGYSIT